MFFHHPPHLKAGLGTTVLMPGPTVIKRRLYLQYSVKYILRRLLLLKEGGKGAYVLLKPRYIYSTTTYLLYTHHVFSSFFEAKIVSELS